jgi:hypothetical protein
MVLRVNGNIDFHITNEPSVRPEHSARESRRSSNIDAHRSGLEQLPPRQRSQSLSNTTKSSEAGVAVLTPTTSNASWASMAPMPTVSSANMGRASSTSPAETVIIPHTEAEHINAGKAGKLPNMSQYNPGNKLKMDQAAETSAKTSFYKARIQNFLPAHAANKINAAISDMDVSTFTADKNSFNLRGQLMKAGLDKAAKDGNINDTEKRLGNYAIGIATASYLIEGEELSKSDKEAALATASDLFSQLVPAEFIGVKDEHRLPTELSADATEGLDLADQAFNNPEILLTIITNSKTNKALKPDA